MKVVMKPIEMIAWFNQEGVPWPLKYKIAAEDRSDVVVKVAQVVSKTEEKMAGNRMILFKCQSEINGTLRPFEIKYEVSTCRWFLYKI